MENEELINKIVNFVANSQDNFVSDEDAIYPSLTGMKIYEAPLVGFVRMCKPEEGTALYHFLASDDCKYITGEDIYVDGGLKAGPAEQLIDAMLSTVE